MFANVHRIELDGQGAPLARYDPYQTGVLLMLGGQDLVAGPIAVSGESDSAGQADVGDGQQQNFGCAEGDGAELQRDLQFRSDAGGEAIQRDGWIGRSVRLQS